MSEYEQSKASLGYVWIKSSKSGNTYLCPAGSITNRQQVSEEELREFGVDESDNPQND